MPPYHYQLPEYGFGDRTTSTLPLLYSDIATRTSEIGMQPTGILAAAYQPRGPDEMLILTKRNLGDQTSSSTSTSSLSTAMSSASSSPSSSSNTTTGNDGGIYPGATFFGSGLPTALLEWVAVAIVVGLIISLITGRYLYIKRFYPPTVRSMLLPKNGFTIRNPFYKKGAGEVGANSDSENNSSGQRGTGGTGGQTEPSSSESNATNTPGGVRRDPGILLHFRAPPPRPTNSHLDTPYFGGNGRTGAERNHLAQAQERVRRAEARRRARSERVTRGEQIGEGGERTGERDMDDAFDGESPNPGEEGFDEEHETHSDTDGDLGRNAGDDIGMQRIRPTRNRQRGNQDVLPKYSLDKDLPPYLTDSTLPSAVATTPVADIPVVVPAEGTDHQTPIAANHETIVSTNANVEEVSSAAPGEVEEQADPLATTTTHATALPAVEAASLPSVQAYEEATRARRSS